MMVKANMTERNLNLVAPLGHKPTAMHMTDTAASLQAASGAVSDLIGLDLWIGDIDSANKRLTSHPSHLGLPIGNLSSQFFANIYMNELDQFVKHQIAARHYIRYVDDFVLLHESAQWLNNAKDRIEQFLAMRLNTKINPKKTILQPIDRGIDFVGQVIKPWRRSVLRRNVSQAVKAIQSAPVKDLLSTSNSYFGLLCQAKSHHDRSVLANAVMARGRSVNRQFTKTYGCTSD